MSFPATDTLATVGTAAAAITVPASSATSFTSATFVQKATTIKVLMNFAKLKPNDLVNLAMFVIKSLIGNLAFPNPPVDLTAFGAAVDTLSGAIVAAMEGGKNAKAVRDKQRKLVIQDLNMLAMYVQNHCNDDTAVLQSTGFMAKSTTRSAPQPVAVPSFRYLDYGINSGSLLVSIKSVTGGKAYFVRYAVMSGSQPGPWTIVPTTIVNKPLTLSGLTPATTYGMQVQALGALGYSDWSTLQTIICV
jgi:hypothetical protein